MNFQERRIIGALLLLFGFSFLAVGMYTGQISRIIELLKSTFTPF